MLDLRGIEFLMFAGLGALAMLFTVTPILAVTAFFIPALWPWVFVPVGVGAIGGFLFAAVLK